MTTSAVNAAEDNDTNADNAGDNAVQPVFEAQDRTRKLFHTELADLESLLSDLCNEHKDSGLKFSANEYGITGMHSWETDENGSEFSIYTINEKGQDLIGVMATAIETGITMQLAICREYGLRECEVDSLELGWHAANFNAGAGMKLMQDADDVGCFNIGYRLAKLFLYGETA